MALVTLLLGTAVLYLVGLSGSGWANSFYSAAVQAGSESWKAFFFGSSDAASSITVDKTPLSLWPMALSVRVFGLSSWSILAPQAIEGVLAVWLLAATVRRTTGNAWAGLLAGLALAVTPVAVLMFRFNNPDAMLVLLLVASVYATMRALESGARHPVRWLAFAGALIGLAFLTKMLQAFLVLPPLALVYLVAARPSVLKRVGHLLIAFGTMLVAGGWWVAIVSLWPATSRPYIGGSQDNSILELTLGYNGFGRLTGDETGSVGGSIGTGGSMWGDPGITRLLSSEIGGQIAWLLPAALVLLAAGLWFTWRRPRTDLVRAGLIVWGGWLLVTGLTFSFMAGIFHSYYTVALAPAVAALVGIGSWLLWEHRRSLVATVVAPAVVVLTTVTSFVLLSRSADFLPWLRWVVLVLGLLSAVAVAGLGWLPKRLGDPGRRDGDRGLAGRPCGVRRADGQRRPQRLDPDRRARGQWWFGVHARRRWPTGWWVRGAARDADRHADRSSTGRSDRWRAGRTALEQLTLDRAERRADPGRGVLHLGGRDDRLQHRGRLPAGHRGACDGDRRLQRLRPEPDARGVPDRRRSRRHPLVHRRRRLRAVDGRERHEHRHRDLGGRQLRGHHGRRRHPLRPEHRGDVMSIAQPWEPPEVVPGTSLLTLEVVIPVYNEERDLAASVERVREHLATFPWSFRITVADNASTDGTAVIARRLAHTYADVRVVHLAEKGRGRALKKVWSGSEAAVLVYMDVDLSTDLNALLPLVAPLISGHSDLAIGSRLRRGSRVERGPKRELISRGYNLLLKGTLRAHFSDAQCGFKAIRSDVARVVLPLVEDNAWFFDTELLVLAERAGLRIHEVPVDWVDDPDSRVDLARTAAADVRGIARLGRNLLTGRVAVGDVAERLGRASADAGGGRLGMQMVMFGLVGVASTMVYAALFLLLRGPFSAFTANLLALLATAVANTAANRRLTFGVRSREGALGHQLRGLVVFAIGLGVTSGSLWLLHAAGSTHRGAEVLVLTVANLVVTVMRFFAMRSWVFIRRVNGRAAPQERPDVPSPETSAHPDGEVADLARAGAIDAAADQPQRLLGVAVPPEHEEEEPVVALLQRQQVTRPLDDLPPAEAEPAATEPQLEPGARLNGEDLAGMGVLEDVAGGAVR